MKSLSTESDTLAMSTRMRLCRLAGTCCSKCESQDIKSELATQHLLASLMNLQRKDGALHDLKAQLRGCDCIVPALAYALTPCDVALPIIHAAKRLTDVLLDVHAFARLLAIAQVVPICAKPASCMLHVYLPFAQG